MTISTVAAIPHNMYIRVRISSDELLESVLLPGFGVGVCDDGCVDEVRVVDDIRLADELLGETSVVGKKEGSILLFKIIPCPSQEV